MTLNFYITAWNTAFNRTYEELKWAAVENNETSDIAFNRTYEELKFPKV